MRRAAWVLLPVLLAACASGPPAPSRPPQELPAAWPGGSAEPAEQLATRWWLPFGGPALDALVARALEANLDLRLAAARVDEAAVAVTLARAAQWPSVDLGAAVTRSRSSQLGGQPLPPGGPRTTAHRVALNTSFEVDLWGRLRHATTAAQEVLLAARHARATVQVGLVGTVVQAWLGVRSLDAQRAAVDRLIELRQGSLALVRRRVDGGLASALELAQAEAALAALAAQQAEIGRQRELLVNQLGLLTGQPGLQLAADGRALPAPPTVPTGLPSQLLTRRPDVQQAEAAMRASFEQFEVTRRSAWPTLALTGSFGAQSADLVDIVQAGARIWSIAPSLLVSIFDAGRNRARSEEARARAEQAALAWQRAAQAAFREVADALASAQALAAQEAALDRQRQAALEAERIVARRYEAGYSGYLEVLDAQRGAQDAALALLRIRQARIDASVALIKALGGGWTADPAG